MVDVKPDEISAILKQQLSGFDTATELEEKGTVLEVGDGIARVYGLSNAHCLLYTSPSPRDRQKSRMPSSA